MQRNPQADMPDRNSALVATFIACRRRTCTDSLQLTFLLFLQHILLRAQCGFLEMDRYTDVLRNANKNQKTMPKIEFRFDIQAETKQQEDQAKIKFRSDIQAETFSSPGCSLDTDMYTDIIRSSSKYINNAKSGSSVIYSS